jgi:hypothetical protein
MVRGRWPPRQVWSLTKLGAGEGLPKGPARRSRIVGDYSSTITGGDLKGKTLSIEIVVALPILPPVP